MTVNATGALSVDVNGRPIPVLPWSGRKTITVGTTPDNRIALPAGTTLITCWVTGALAHLKTGTSTVTAAATDGDADVTVPEGQAVDIPIPAGHTHLVAAGTGAVVYVSKRA